MENKTIKTFVGLQLREKLDDENTPFSQRIALADHVFHASSTSFNRKEDLVLTWVTDKVDVESSHANEKELLAFLEKCLSSLKVKSGLVEIRFSICEKICQIITRMRNIHTKNDLVCILQKCMTHIFNSVTFHNIFKKQCVVFRELIVSYINSLTEENSVEDCVFVTNYIINLYNTTFVKDGFRLQFIEGILLPIVDFFIKIEKTNEKSASIFTELLYKLISQILLPDEDASFQYTLGMNCMDSVKYEHPYVYKVMETLIDLPKSKKLKQTEYVYPAFLRAFISVSTCKKSIFDVFEFLINLIGFSQNEKLSTETIIKNINELPTLWKILKVVSEMILSDNTKYETEMFSAWSINVLPHFSNNDLPLSSDLLKVLREIILSLIPFSEKEVFPYIVKILLRKKTGDVLNTYIEVLNDIFNLFHKLSRMNIFIPKLLLEMIPRLIDVSESDLSVEDIFPQACLLALSKLFMTSLSLLKILTNINSCILKVCEEKTSDSCFQLDHRGGVLLIESLFGLASCVLQIQSTADTATSYLEKTEFIRLFNGMVKFLREFGVSLTKCSFNDPATSAYLNLCYSWSSVNIMLKYYFLSRQKKISFYNEQTDTSPKNLSYILDCLNPEEWNILASNIIEFGEAKTKHGLFQLMELKMAVLKTNKIPGSLTAKFLLEHADNEWICAHFNSFIYYTELEEVVSIVETICTCEYNVLLRLIKTPEFQNNRHTVTVLSICLLKEIGRECKKNGRKLLHKMISDLSLHELLMNEDEEHSEKVQQELSELVNMLGKDVKKNRKRLDFEISPPIQRNLDLLSKLPLVNLKANTRVLLISSLMAAARCLPFCDTLYDRITDILSFDIQIPKTHYWPVILQWFASSLEPYIHRTKLLKRLMKYFVRSIDNSIIEIVESLVSTNDTATLILVSFLSVALREAKMFNQLDEGEHSKRSTCLMIYNYLTKNLITTEPSLELLPVLKALVLGYSRPVKTLMNVDSNEEEYLVVLPRYIDLIVEKFQKCEEIKDSNTNCNLEQECLFLQLTIKKYRNKYPKNVFTDWVLWSYDTGIHEKLKQVYLCITSLLSHEELNLAVNNLFLMTKDLLHDASHTKRLCLFWEVLLRRPFNYKEDVNVINNAVSQLEDTLLPLLFEIRKPGKYVNITEFFRILITSQVELSSLCVELCLEVVSAVPVDAEPQVINGAIDVLLSLLSSREYLFQPIISSFLARVSYIAYIIAAASHTPNIVYPVRELAACAFNIERMTSLLKKSLFGALVHNTIADIITLFTQFNIEPAVKMHLENTVYNLMLNISDKDMEYQSIAIPDTSKETLKRLYRLYKKFYNRKSSQVRRDFLLNEHAIYY